VSWTQPHVAPLLRAISSNGYSIIYLTSRPLFLAASTRLFLSSLHLPSAPVITSPDTAIASLHRELSSAAHGFKSAALQVAQIFDMGFGFFRVFIRLACRRFPALFIPTTAAVALCSTPPSATAPQTRKHTLQRAFQRSAYSLWMRAAG
jgi:hypothetical protein